MIAQHVSAHHMTSHCITWHDTTQAITSHQITSAHITSHRIASKQVTSPPWNSRRLVHSKDMVWASRWSVALRTFYRQILSLLYSSFFFWNFRPRLARELLVKKVKYNPECVYLYLIRHSLITSETNYIVVDCNKGFVTTACFLRALRRKSLSVTCL